MGSWKGRIISNVDKEGIWREYNRKREKGEGR